MKELSNPRLFSPVAGILFLGVAILLPVQTVWAEPAAKVQLNKQSAGVYFNDGDSFRVLKGRDRGAKARLYGFNTLESHGAVHQWGTWTAKELYHLAKMATIHARLGSWSCTADDKTDTYGRLLVYCEDLAISQIRNGFAHAMSIDDNPGKPKLVEAQREAIAAKRGMWAHGVPEFVLTSLHSTEEDTSGRGTYNRLVSSADGHSIMWKHNRKYQECENVCLTVYPDDPALLPAIATQLKAEAPELIVRLTDAQLLEVLGTYQRIRLIDRPVVKKHREALQAVLDGYAKAGRFGKAAGTNGSCMIHVPFQRRYGGGRAECLKK